MATSRPSAPIEDPLVELGRRYGSRVEVRRHRGQPVAWRLWTPTPWRPVDAAQLDAGDGPVPGQLPMFEDRAR